jgi:mono/diheme cytochrome c family protein
MTLLGKDLAPRFQTALLALLTFLFFSTTSVAQDGEKLFRANCASCHKLDKKLIGPALTGVTERWESRENLVAWIKNSQEYMETSGDKYATDLFNEYNGSIMPAQAVNDAEIEAILGYIENPPEPAVAEEVVVNTNDQAQGPDYTNYWLAGFLILALILIRVLYGVATSMRRLDAEVEGTEFDTTSYWGSITKWMGNNKRATLGISIVLLVFVLVQTWYGAKTIGVYQGYAPEQPIKFSHKIHAGDNAINCVYCHHSAEKGKNAGIPSVNVCMNCHKGIEEGSLYGTEEISKIYEAAGYNPETAAYDKPQKPIEWVRIHNLPDFAYFNHSQHVIVGQQECQTCHGEVETYDYPMKQYSELTMGWCINCHRETEVQTASNDYYSKLHEQLKEKYKDDPERDKYTVEDIGGLECAKCHY